MILPSQNAIGYPVNRMRSQRAHDRETVIWLDRCTATSANSVARLSRRIGRISIFAVPSINANTKLCASSKVIGLSSTPSPRACVAALKNRSRARTQRVACCTSTLILSAATNASVLISGCSRSTKSELLKATCQFPLIRIPMKQRVPRSILQQAIDQSGCLSSCHLLIWEFNNPAGYRLFVGQELFWRKGRLTQTLRKVKRCLARRSTK